MHRFVSLMMYQESGHGDNMSVDKIVCVGKNYLDHALEFGEVVPENPVLFLKPFSVLKQAQSWGEQITLAFPDGDPAVQPECEIVLRVAHDGFRMTEKEAKSAISAVTLGLDMTLRTQQTQLKKCGHPWTTSKVFMDAAVLGPWIPYHSFENYMDVTFQFEIDGKRCQSAKGQDMMMHPEQLLVYISQHFPLKAHDIIFTGTPAGVMNVTRQTTAVLSWDHYSYQVKWV